LIVAESASANALARSKTQVRFQFVVGEIKVQDQKSPQLGRNQTALALWQKRN